MEVICIEFKEEVRLYLPFKENLDLFGAKDFDELKKKLFKHDWFGLNIIDNFLTEKSIDNSDTIILAPCLKIKCFLSLMYPGYYWPGKVAWFANWYTYGFGGSSYVTKYSSCVTDR